MAVEPTLWASDVKVSMPLPPKVPRQVPMFGFAFTEFGLAHDIDAASYAQISTPSYIPDDYGKERVYWDEDLDREPSSMEYF